MSYLSYDETFKSAVIELTKCTSDTNLQHNYVGDGDGEPHLAGLGISPIKITSGTLPSAEILFKKSLHEVNGLLESQEYLKNLSSADVAAARQQSIVLDDTACILNGQPFTTGSSAANASQSNIPAPATTTSTGNTSNHDNGTDTPMSDASREEERKKTKSPAVALAEAALKSQEAAVLEAKNFELMIKLQKEKLSLHKRISSMYKMNEQKIGSSYLKSIGRAN